MCANDHEMGHAPGVAAIVVVMRILLLPPLVVVVVVDGFDFDNTADRSVVVVAVVPCPFVSSSSL